MSREQERLGNLSEAEVRNCRTACGMKLMERMLEE